MFLESTKNAEDEIKWKLVDVANNSQLGSEERVKEKIKRIKRCAIEAAKSRATQLVSHNDRGEVQWLREALQQRDREAEVCCIIEI